MVGVSALIASATASDFRFRLTFPVATIDQFYRLVFIRVRAEFVSIKNANELKHDFIVKSKCA